MKRWLSTRCDRRWCWRYHREVIWPLNNEPRVQRCLRHQWTREDHEANTARFLSALSGAAEEEG